MLKVISRKVLNNRLFTDRHGNFGIMTAILLPVLLGAGGVVLELGNALQTKSGLQNNADAATLAAATALRDDAKEMTEEEATQDALNFINNFKPAGAKEEDSAIDAEKLKNGTTVEVSSTPTDKGITFKVTANITYPITLNPLLGFLGAETMNVSVTSTAESTTSNETAISMYLVLDRSGSMSFKTNTVDKTKNSCQNYTSQNWSKYPNLDSSKPCYTNKSTSLKTAVSYLVDTLNKADPSYKANGSPQSTLIRTAAIAYNNAAFSAQAMDWGTKKTNTYVQQIPQYPSGGTDASAALKTAFDALKTTDKNKTEINAHATNKNSVFERYIIFMTDGEMTGNSASWNSNYDAAVRTVCADAKKDGIKIFSVAFMAPDKGKSLLNACATSGDNYYEPESMEEIVAAFGDIARKAANNMSRLTN